jgi:hypothetical protein
MSRQRIVSAPELPSPRTVLWLWPWRAAIIAAILVDLAVGAARRFDFAGIYGFSTTNYGWLAFSFVGGVGLAWRLAEPPAGWRLPLRVLIAPALSYIACFVAVTVMGLVFLPHQSLAETLTTDAPGRAIWLSLLVAAVGCVSEALWVAVRWLRRHRPG